MTKSEKIIITNYLAKLDNSVFTTLVTVRLNVTCKMESFRSCVNIVKNCPCLSHRQPVKTPAYKSIYSAT